MPVGAVSSNSFNSPKKSLNFTDVNDGSQKGVITIEIAPQKTLSNNKSCSNGHCHARQESLLSKLGRWVENLVKIAGTFLAVEILCRFAGRRLNHMIAEHQGNPSKPLNKYVQKWKQSLSKISENLPKGELGEFTKRLNELCQNYFPETKGEQSLLTGTTETENKTADNKTEAGNKNTESENKNTEPENKTEAGS